MHLRSFGIIVVALQSGAIVSAASPTDSDPLEGRLPVNALPSNISMTSRDGRSAAARGPLPDPVLLDGSNQPAEKKSDYGMLGEFEIPGSDEKGDKTAAADQADQKQQQQGAGGSKQQDNKSQKGGGSQSKSAQQSQGGGGASDKADDSQSGGGAGEESADAAQSGGGSSSSKSGAKSSRGGGSAKSIAQNDPNASAQGAESSGLSSPDGGEAAAQGDAAPSKPGEMKIGDATMQIKTQTTGTAPNVVGLQQPVGKDVPQQYDARTPGGGRQSGNSNGNKGVEKGQTMPTGL